MALKFTDFKIALRSGDGKTVTVEAYCKETGDTAFAIVAAGKDAFEIAARKFARLT
jgi:hypothetical protein